ERHDRIGSARNRGTGHDAHRLTRLERWIGRTAGGDVGDHLERHRRVGARARDVGEPHPEAGHGGVVEQRQIDGGPHRLAENATERGTQRHPPRLQHRHRREDAIAVLFDGDHASCLLRLYPSMPPRSTTASTPAPRSAWAARRARIPTWQTTTTSLPVSSAATASTSLSREASGRCLAPRSIPAATSSASRTAIT